MRRALGSFEKTIQKKQIPQEILLFHPSASSLNSLATVVEAGFANSNSQGRTLIKQGGFHYNDETVTDPNAPLNFNDGDILRKGTMDYRKVALK